MKHGKFRDSLSAELKLTDDQLKAIGCLAVESTNLEVHIDAFIRSVAKLDDVSFEVFVGRLTLGSKTKMLHALYWPRLENLPEIRASFKAIYDDITDMITKRNTVIHGTWGDPDETKLISLLELMTLEQKADSVARSKRGKPVPATEVMDLALDFAQRKKDLLQWWVSYERASP
jgi:hypothetical protein